MIANTTDAYGLSCPLTGTVEQLLHWLENKKGNTMEQLPMNSVFLRQQHTAQAISSLSERFMF